ncbi:MAG: 30S ribosomal protein S6 [Sphaerobacter sp.]|nr:30S ribosomal protein S6 [Sphaerobacter sp.]
MPTYQPLPRPYELMVLISPEVTDEALVAEVDAISALIAEHGGQVTHVKRDTPWGRRRLAYPINKFRDATYVLYHFIGIPSRVIEFERDLKLRDRVIRYLLIRQEEAPAAAEPAAEVAATTEAAEAVE